MSEHRHPFDDPQPGDVIGWRNPPTKGPIQNARVVETRVGSYVTYRQTHRRNAGGCSVSTWKRWIKANMPECIHVATEEHPHA